MSSDRQRVDLRLPIVLVTSTDTKADELGCTRTAIVERALEEWHARNPPKARPRISREKVAQFS